MSATQLLRRICVLVLVVTLAGCSKDTKNKEKDACSELKSTIKNAVLLMESSNADNQKYPGQIPWTQVPANGIVVELYDNNAEKYSLRATHPACNKTMLTSSGKTEITEQAK